MSISNILIKPIENMFGSETSATEKKRGTPFSENRPPEPKRLKQKRESVPSTLPKIIDEKWQRSFPPYEIRHAIGEVHPFGQKRCRCLSSLKFQLKLDLIDAKTLDKIRPKLSWTDVLTITDQAFEYLEDMKDHGLVHGNLKLKNMLFEPKARNLTVLDHSMKLKKSKNSVSQNSAASEILKSHKFPAPEVAEGKEGTPSSDLWSLGMIIYNLVTESGFLEIRDYFDMSQQLTPELRPKPAFTKWEAFFRTKAELKQMPPQIIDSYVSILNKIFRFEGRASIEEVSAEFHARDIGQEIKFIVSVQAKNATLIINSDGISTVFDNSLWIAERCVHVPKNPFNIYTITLHKSNKLVLDEIPIYLLPDVNKTLLDLDIFLDDTNDGFNNLVFRVSKLGRDQRILIQSCNVLKNPSTDEADLTEGFTLASDPGLALDRSMLLVPQSPSGTYLVTLTENGRVIIDKHPLYLRETSHYEINIPELIARDNWRQNPPDLDTKDWAVLTGK